MNAKNVIPQHFTEEFRTATAKFASDFADTDTGITESFQDITTCQKNDWMIGDATVKNREMSIRRWSKVLDNAEIKSAYDLDDSERRAIFLTTASEAIDNWELGTTTGAIVRSVEQFTQMLRTINYSKSGMIGKMLAKVVQSKRLIVKDKAPYSVEDTAKLMTSLCGWLDNPKTCPSFADRASAGKRIRTPSFESVAKMACAIALATNSGARVGAMLELRRDNLNLETGDYTWSEYKGQMVLREHKGKLANFQIEMVRPYVELMDEKYPDSEHVFLNRSGKHQTTQTAFTMPLKRMLEHLEIVTEDEIAGFHRFRHSIACEAIKAGASFHDVSKALNNSEGMIAKVYGRYMDNHLGQSTRSVFTDKISEAMGIAKEAINPTLQPMITELEQIKQNIWATAQTDMDEEFGIGSVELQEPAVFVGIPEHVKLRTMTKMAENRWNVAPIKGFEPLTLGLRDNTKNAVNTISNGAKEALEQIKAGNTEMAQAILEHLSTWGDE